MVLQSTLYNVSQHVYLHFFTITSTYTITSHIFKQVDLYQAGCWLCLINIAKASIDSHLEQYTNPLKVWSDVEERCVFGNVRRVDDDVRGEGGIGPIALSMNAPVQKDVWASSALLQGRCPQTAPKRTTETPGSGQQRATKTSGPGQRVSNGCTVRKQRRPARCNWRACPLDSHQDERQQKHLYAGIREGGGSSCPRAVLRTRATERHLCYIGCRYR